MTTTPPPAPRRLTKRHVEALLEGYDADPLGALAQALSVLTGAAGGFDDQVAACRFEPDRMTRLQRREVAALDELAAELNESRVVPLAAMPG